jgi:hypothetical protein
MEVVRTHKYWMSLKAYNKKYSVSSNQSILKYNYNKDTTQTRTHIIFR